MITDFPIRPGNISDPAPDYPWPAGKRCAVVPAFDVDAESAWLQYDAANTDRLVTLSHEKLCTVSRTVMLPTPVRTVIADAAVGERP